jgi:zinc transporter, ZIP family
MVAESLVAGGLGSLAAGAATGLGTLPVLVFGNPSERANDTMLGFAAGVMLAASFFSLIIPGIDEASRIVGPGAPAVGIVILGILIGAATLWAVNRFVPHEHAVLGKTGPHPEKLRRIWLFVLAITIHNFPEGLAVGVSFGGGEMLRGTTVATAIGLQNIPEGLAVAVAISSLGYSRGYSCLMGLLSGMVEPIGGFFGAAAVTLAAPLLPWGLGFAAGAMIYVISSEIIPETHRKGHEQFATSGLMVGLVVMMFLDVTLGS